LLDVTGLPMRASAVSAIAATRRDVQETNTASQASWAPSFSTASMTEPGVMRAPTASSSSSSKEPTAGISSPRAMSFPRNAIMMERV
jgi:hypothetical protein